MDTEEEVLESILNGRRICTLRREGFSVRSQKPRTGHFIE